MSAPPWTRVALRGDIGDALDRIAEREGWGFETFVEETKDQPFELVWTTEDGRASIHYVEDPVLGIDYVLARGKRHDDVVNLLRSEVDTVPPSEVVAGSKEAHTKEEMIGATYLAAATASSKFDPALFDVIERALSSSAPQVRLSGIVSCGYVEWKQCRSPLERLAKSDPDDDVRRAARAALQGLGEVWKR
ncbi:MAG: hypothetical protein ACRDQ2_11030 [Gaiellales bacterium]